MIRALIGILSTLFIVSNGAAQTYFEDLDLGKAIENFECTNYRSGSIEDRSSDSNLYYYPVNVYTAFRNRNIPICLIHSWAGYDSGGTEYLFTEGGKLIFIESTWDLTRTPFEKLERFEVVGAKFGKRIRYNLVESPIRPHEDSSPGDLHGVELEIVTLLEGLPSKGKLLCCF